MNAQRKLMEIDKNITKISRIFASRREHIKNSKRKGDVDYEK